MNSFRVIIPMGIVFHVYPFHCAYIFVLLSLEMLNIVSQKSKKNVKERERAKSFTCAFQHCEQSEGLI